MDPQLGLFNKALAALPFIEQSPFNIFSVGGIVWANLMGNGISVKVMLLTPAFRNMDAALEEAARVSGASNIRTALRVTLPLMISPIMLVFALQLLRVFQSFEVEYLLGTPIDFYVYSTKIFALIRTDVPQYGEATALASITLLVIALIIPLQRWVLERRRYTTISGTFKPGLIDLGRWNYVLFGAIAFLLVLLTIAPLIMLVLGSFMTRIGYFVLGFTLDHWKLILKRSVVPRCSAHYSAPRLVCFNRKPAPLLSDRLHPGTNAFARPLGVGFDGMGYRGHPGNPLRDWGYCGCSLALQVWPRFTGPYGRCSSWCCCRGRLPGSTS